MVLCIAVFNKENSYKPSMKMQKFQDGFQSQHQLPLSWVQILIKNDIKNEKSSSEQHGYIHGNF